MKKFLVIGNPIEHSLSPKLHNYWFKKNNIDANYDKKLLNESDLKNIIFEVKKKKITGINVTVPFKKLIIPFLDELSTEANQSQSVNTISEKSGKIIGHNTDIAGFELGLRHFKYDVKNKKVFILGSGGVVSSIILALNKMKASKIILSNRTKEKAENMKNLFKFLDVVEWGEIPNFDMIINATSVGLKKDDKINFDYSKIGSNKFFYDIIYNPPKTNFLKKAEDLGNKIENGKKMFIYQAAAAFKIWHNIQPEINNKVFKVLDK